MRALFLTLGIGMTLVNFAFADEPPDVRKSKREVIAECYKKHTADERKECIENLYRGGGEVTGEGGVGIR